MNQKGFNGQIKQPAQAPPQIYPNIPYVTYLNKSFSKEI